MTDAEHRRLAALIHDEVGIRVGDSKGPFLVARLGRRLRALGFATFDQYLDHLRNDDADGAELRLMVEAVTTNTTRFFRESLHFDYLKQHVLGRATPARPLKIWSAACSTGQEPYSLAMTVRDALGHDSHQLASILATDVDTSVLQNAARGVYPTSALDGVAAHLWQPHMLRGKGDAAGFVKVHRDIDKLVSFETLNLTSDPWSVQGPFDVIMCRNVLIYFDEDTCRSLVSRMGSMLTPEGVLMLGHAETSWGRSVGLTHVGDAVFRPMGASPPRRAHVSSAPTRPDVRDVQAGDVVATAEPTVLRALLGSCVATCLYDPVAMVGGMNHFALANQSSDDAPNPRYGSTAIDQLIDAVVALGAQRTRLQAKVFGACRVLDIGTPDRNDSVETQNADYARRALETLGIPVVSSSLGGDKALEVIFDPTCGRAGVRHIDATHDTTRRHKTPHS